LWLSSPRENFRRNATRLLVVVAMPKQPIKEKCDGHRVTMTCGYGRVSSNYNDLARAVRQAEAWRETFPSAHITIEIATA
jgi:predicted site-specific integrase-resolvase